MAKDDGHVTAAAPLALTTTKAQTPAIPTEIRETLGRSPLTNFEDEALYEKMLASFADAVSPKDAVEWSHVKDITDLTWEVQRISLAKSAVLNSETRRQIENLVNTSGKIKDRNYRTDFSLINNIFRGQKQAMSALLKIMNELNVTENSLSAAAFNSSLERIEQLERLREKMLSRRDASLREIDRRRDAFARRLRAAAQATDDVTDAEFE